MANRCYLYSTNLIPGPNAKANGRKLIGISEWSYNIPIVFKLLLSGNTKTCLSSIWNHAEEIALIGDYASGVKKLEWFLSQIELPAAKDLINEAIEFLNKPENRSNYFVLESAEVFALWGAPPLEENLRLVEEIRDLQNEVEQWLQSLVPRPVESPKPVSFFSKLFGRAPEPQSPVRDLMQPIIDLGLGNWSNTLYFDFTNE